MNQITEFEQPCNEQTACQLFNILPGEVRDRVFTYALTCYENPEKVFDKNTPYTRPSYNAPLAADTNLLRTCQRIYSESWWRTWVSAVHTFFLAWDGRRPSGTEYMTTEKLQPSLNQLYASHGEIEISHVRVYAQLCYLESGAKLDEILNMQNFFPRQITITIRHHDWWSWENDDHLQIGSDWVQDCRFPDSIREIRMELESLQRKKDQIDWIALEMIKGWNFVRRDGTILSAQLRDCEIDSWSGSSTWEKERWIRDETKPETNEYYIKTVVWKPNKAMTQRPDAANLHVPYTFHQIHMSRPYIPTHVLKKAEIPPGLTADETKKRVELWELDNPPFEDEFEDDEMPLDEAIGSSEDEELEQEDDDPDWEL